MTKTALIPALSPGKAVWLAIWNKSGEVNVEFTEQLAETIFQERGDVDSAYKLVTSHLRLVAKIAMYIAAMARSLPTLFQRAIWA